MKTLKHLSKNIVRKYGKVNHANVICTLTLTSHGDSIVDTWLYDWHLLYINKTF